MAQELINIGAVADDGTGDTIRGAGIKINNNFTEVYAQPNFSLSQLSFDGNVISATQSNADIELAGNGTGNVQISDLTIDSVINLSDNDIKKTLEVQILFGGERSHRFFIFLRRDGGGCASTCRR